jgi:mannitol-1-phosphate 5-dehydrogenase
MNTMARRFVGIGFGPIQSGLFLFEAARSGAFEQLTVADVDDALVNAVRDNGGRFTVNVAGSGGIRQRTIDGIRVLNPKVPGDRAELVSAIAEASEIATALPSVDIFDAGGVASPASCLADGFRLRQRGSQPAVVYTAENHNHAAEILEQKVSALLSDGGVPETVQMLNTVIGKMSGVICDQDEQRRLGLELLAPGYPKAVLVEEFNRILISRINLLSFHRGIAVFEEKDDLIPFEEAKLYGHNAVHALLGYLAYGRGYKTMAEAGSDPELMQKAREAFLGESGAGLLRRYGGTDPLFTAEGFGAYAEDLLTRMTNPFLCDSVYRVIRDPLRKLRWDDRLVGAMRLALAAGVRPVRFAEGARIAALYWAGQSLLDQWPVEIGQEEEASGLAKLVFGGEFPIQGRRAQ